jgi:hypothetical protein
MAQLPQGLGLDLANALAGDAELLADLFERPKTAILQAKSENQDLALALTEFVQGFANLKLQDVAGCDLQRRG